jgi:hypothetical protein
MGINPFRTGCGSADKLIPEPTFKVVPAPAGRTRNGVGFEKLCSSKVVPNLPRKSISATTSGAEPTGLEPVMWIAALIIHFGSQILGMPRCERCQPKPWSRESSEFWDMCSKLGIAQTSPMKCSTGCSGRSAARIHKLFADRLFTS